MVAGSIFLRDQYGTPLAASDNVAGVGVFLQLIHITSGTVAHDVDFNVTDGVTGGDVVLAWDSLGHDDVTQFGESTTTSGQWLWGNTYDGAGLIVDHGYYVRAWALPSPDYNNGAIPKNPQICVYANSEVGIYNGVTMTIDPIANRDMLTTLPIPEPASLGLGIVGLICLRLFQRKRK